VTDDGKNGFLSLGYYYLFGSVVSGLHISPPKGGPLGFL
jgi:hypothetical protein